MVNVVSFCLYGNNIKYCHGILEAVISYKLYFINWEIWVYISEISVPKIIIDILKSLNCKVTIMKEKGSIYEIEGRGPNENNEPMFWRFLPLYDPSVNVWLSRDADSRATKREKEFVDEFIRSGKAVHSILDHRCHGGLMGGGSGFNNISLKKYKPIEHVDDFINRMFRGIYENKRMIRGSDQNWLREAFREPLLNYDCFVHICKDALKIHIERVGNNFENIELVRDVKLCKCTYKIVENVPNFIGAVQNIDPKSRNNVFLPIIK